MKRRLITAFVAFCAVLILILGLFAMHEVEGQSASDPSGDYRAVVTFHQFQSWLSRAPGDSSGKSGYITIYDRSGTSFGKIPVDMIAQLSDLRWSENGASIPAYCEWDFDRRSYGYWNADQTRKTINYK